MKAIIVKAFIMLIGLIGSVHTVIGVSGSCCSSCLRPCLFM